MKNKIKVSVIIPVFNSEKTIGECLDSILNQTYTNYEIIIVDNNSTDQTTEILKTYSKKIIYVFEKERKRGCARNTGERNAKGEIILMTDADCIVNKEWIQSMIKPILENNYDSVQGSQTPYSKKFFSNQYQKHFEYKFKNRKSGEIIGFLDTKNFAIKKSVLEKVGFTSRDVFSGNDTDLSIKLQKNKVSFCFLKNVKVIHHHPENIRVTIQKQIYRAYWTAYIYGKYPNLTQFSVLNAKTNLKTKFFRFFYKSMHTLFNHGPSLFVYELVAGISWEIGLIKYYKEKKVF